MWKARKIELIKNSETWRKDRSYFADCYTLEINGVHISNSITENLTIPTDFQTSVCDYCGQEGCNSGNMLSIKRHEKSLLFIPCFDCMEEYLERDNGDENEDYGDSECPPHEWYENGILEVDEIMLPEFLSLLKGFDLNKIPVITTEEMDKVLEWENLVKEKPVTGFMRLGRV